MDWLDPADLRVEVYTTGPAMRPQTLTRITHLPTGTVTEDGAGPSQIQQRERAIAELRRRLGL